MKSFILLLIIELPIILSSLVFSIDILIRASSPNLVLVYRLATRNTDSSSIELISLGTINFKLRLFTIVEMTSLKLLFYLLLLSL